MKQKQFEQIMEAIKKIDIKVNSIDARLKNVESDVKQIKSLPTIKKELAIA